MEENASIRAEGTEITALPHGIIVRVHELTWGRVYKAAGHDPSNFSVHASHLVTVLKCRLGCMPSGDRYSAFPTSFQVRPM